MRRKYLFLLKICFPPLKDTYRGGMVRFMFHWIKLDIEELRVVWCVICDYITMKVRLKLCEAMLSEIMENANEKFVNKFQIYYDVFKEKIICENSLTITHKIPW